jgi:hypothetical protein
MGTSAAPRTVEQGAGIIIKIATQEEAVTGGFYDENGSIPW